MRAINIEDFRRRARRRLPRAVFDFIDGGVDDERALVRNVEGYRDYAIVPRYMRDVSSFSLVTSVLGRDYAMPFGVSPTGAAGLSRPGGDQILGAASRAADVPFILSGASHASVEALYGIAGESLWYQVYLCKDRAISADILHRAADAGVRNLVVTIDMPVPAKRERNLRNGFGEPVLKRPRLAVDALTRPAWLFGYLRAGGLPILGDWARYADRPENAANVLGLFNRNWPCPGLSWKDIERVRAQWPGRMIVKGVLHPGDAETAVECGADGIIVSNHGGRQLNTAPASIEMLPHVVDAVGAKTTVMLDSGIRSGSDIVVGLCLGAKFVFVGRATLYGLAAGGRTGVDGVLSILKQEVTATMGQMGCASVPSLAEAEVIRARADAVPIRAWR